MDSEGCLYLILALWLSQYCRPSVAQSSLVSNEIDSRCITSYGIVADMTDCAGFILCLGDKVRREILCSEGLDYDAERKTCDFEKNVKCGERPKESVRSCYIANVNITIKVENMIQEPFFMIETQISAPRQPFYNFLLMAAGKDDRFKFSTLRMDNIRDAVTMINGLAINFEDRSIWVLFKEGRDQPIEAGVNLFLPEDGDVYIFQFFSFKINK